MIFFTHKERGKEKKRFEWICVGEEEKSERKIDK